MEFVVDQLIEFSSSKDEELRDISGLGTSCFPSQHLTSSCIRSALKTITSELPRDGPLAPKACAKLTPKLLSQVATVSYFHYVAHKCSHVFLGQSTA